MGADAPACAALAGGADVKAFFVRKEAKAHGLQRQIEGPPLEPGERCLIVEDVVTTGGSTVQAIEAVRAAGYDVAGVVDVLDRLAGGAEAIARRRAARPTRRWRRSTTSTRTAPTAADPAARLGRVLEALDLSTVRARPVRARGDRRRGHPGRGRVRLRARGRPDAADRWRPAAVPVTPLVVALPMVVAQAVAERRALDPAGLRAAHRGPAARDRCSARGC